MIINELIDADIELLRNVTLLREQLRTDLKSFFVKGIPAYDDTVVTTNMLWYKSNGLKKRSKLISASNSDDFSDIRSGGDFNVLVNIISQVDSSQVLYHCEEDLHFKSDNPPLWLEEQDVTAMRDRNRLIRQKLDDRATTSLFTLSENL